MHLRDQAFEPALPRGFEQILARILEVIRNAQQRKRLHDLLQQPLSFDQRHAPQIVAIQIEQIEDIKMDRILLRHLRDRVRVLRVNPRLDQLEMRNALLIQHHDLAIQNGLLRLDVMRQHLQLRILPFASIVVPRIDVQRPVVDVDQSADPVPLDFEDPVGAFRELVRQCRAHGREETRHRGA